MERSYPHYTQCATPGDSYKYTTSFLGLTADVVVGILVGGGISALVWKVLGVGGWACAGAIAFWTFAIWWAPNFKHWYYNHRLMCIDDGRCTVGTLVGNTWVATDGDQKFDVLVAPFAVSEVERLFRSVIAAYPAQYGLGPADPGAQALGEYVSGLDETSRSSLYMRVVREEMLTRPGSDFLGHFLVRDETEMGSDAFNHTPDDTFAAAPDFNPMFRMDPSGTLAPYLHQELEGNRLAILMDNLLAVAIATLAATVALCYWFGPWGAAFGIVAAIVLWFLANWINDPDDGASQQTDAGLVDPAYEGGEISSISLGDTIVVYGDWIADEEHDNYFELHPVRAIYLLCRSEAGDNWEPLQDLTALDRDARCSIPIEVVTQRAWVEICELVHEAENPDPNVVERLVMDTGTALSVAAGVID